MKFDIDKFVFCMTIDEAKTNTDIAPGSTVSIVGKNTMYYCYAANADGRVDITGGRFLERIDTDITYLKATADVTGDGTTDPNVPPNSYIPYTLFMAAIKKNTHTRKYYIGFR